ncbi:TPA: HNH endonuclease signature motif containing protein [Salmonella enterica subsp. enterica serovar Waycross]
MIWNEIFEYRDGFIFWKQNHYLVKNIMARMIGRKVVNQSSDGYVRFYFRKKPYSVHRVVWEMHNGPIPDGMEIDHINHIRTDNRIENLRLVSHQDNQKNQKIHKKNTSGHSGVSWSNTYKLWVAKITHSSKHHYLGMHKTKSSAIKARKDAEILLGFHINHGK